MQIELIGCTGAGKSTLLQGMLKACQAQGLEAFSGDDYVLAKARLGWVRGYLARTLLVDLVSLTTCLVTFRKNFGFINFVCKKILGWPRSIGWFQKINILRNMLKKIGIYEIVDRTSLPEQIIFLDEGTLHTAHYLFVHLTINFPDTDLLDFARSVPLPDEVVYLRPDIDVLVQRTMARGHKRIRGGSYELVEHFILQAVSTFDGLVQVPALASKLFVVNGDQQITPPREFQSDRSQGLTFNLLKTGLDYVKPVQPANSGRVTPPGLSG